MKNKTLTSLVIVTAIVVIGAGYAVLSRQSAVTRTVVEEAVFPDLLAQINDVAAIEVTGPEHSFRVRHDGDQWVVSSLADYPAEFDRVKQALLAVAELKTVEAKTADPERHGALGLNEPGSEDGAAQRVRVLGGDDAVLADLLLGNAGRGTKDLVYLRRGGEDQTWVARRKPDIGDDPRDWVDTMLTKVDIERVKRITLDHADGEQVVIYKEEHGDTEFFLDNVPEEGSLKSPLSLDSVARVIAVLRFEEVFDAGDIPDDQEPSVVGTFETFDGATVTVSLYGEEDAIWAKVAASYDADAAVAPALVPEEDMGLDDLPPELQSQIEGAEPVDGEEEPVEPEQIDVAGEIDALVARTHLWAFKLPDFKVEHLQTRNEKLISLPEPEPEPGADPSSEVPPNFEDLMPRVPGITE